MSSSNQPQQPQHEEDVDSEPEMLRAEDALEEIADDGDIAMDSDEDGGGAMDEDDDDEPEEIQLHNDSVAYFDTHKDSVFAIAQHPTRPTLIASGGSEGDADDAPGKGYVFDTSTIPARPLLPETFSGEPSTPPTSLTPIFEIDGHKDSINAVAFTRPAGEFLLSAGLDGRLRAYAVSLGGGGDSRTEIQFVGEAQEVPEINWLAPCPDGARRANVFALGASDGSVWVYRVDGAADPPLEIIQSYFLHTGPVTAGAWTADGALLATVSDDGSLYVWDPFGVAAGAGVASRDGSSIIALTEADARFAVEGGLYSVACAPSGGFLAVGGAGGAIKIVGLPKLGSSEQRTGGGGGRRGGAGDATQGQAGQILASLHAQGDGVETLSFSTPVTGPGSATSGTGSLLAAGSVDGSIAVYDTQRSFQVRRLVSGAHGDFSVVKVEFVRASPHLLTSCGMDGVVRRWDLRGTTATTAAALQRQPQQQQSQAQAQAQSQAVAGLLKEWRGHRGDGEGGGVLGFVQGDTGERIVTAGDDGVVLVFEA